VLDNYLYADPKYQEGYTPLASLTRLIYWKKLMVLEDKHIHLSSNSRSPGKIKPLILFPGIHFYPDLRPPFQQSICSYIIMRLILA
jgi:hypothetical protein